MITAEFYITTSYSILSIVLYFLVIYLIIKNKKVFNSFYYNIILIDSIINMYTYFNSLIVLRLPIITCKECLLAPLMSQIPGLNFFGCMYIHLAYVQYLMILSLTLNRLSAVAFPMKYEAIWKRLFFFLMLFNLLGPFAATYPWFMTTVTLAYSDHADVFKIVTKPDIYDAQNLYLIISMAVLTILCTAITVTTFIIYGYRAPTADHSIETRLLAYSVIYSVIQLFATLDVVIINVGVDYQISSLVTVGVALLPYVSDALTFSSPYILLLCSSTLRALLKKMILGIVSKHNVVSPVLVSSQRITNN